MKTEIRFFQNSCLFLNFGKVFFRFLLLQIISLFPFLLFLLFHKKNFAFRFTVVSTVFNKFGFERIYIPGGGGYKLFHVWPLYAFKRGPLMLSYLFLIAMADFLLAKRRRLFTPSNTPLLSTSHMDCVGMLQLHGGVEQSRGHRGGSVEAESRLRRSKYHVRWEELPQSEWERWVLSGEGTHRRSG